MSHNIISSPPAFDGTLAELFENYIEKLLPHPEEVEWLHRLLVEHTRAASPALVVCQLTGLERGQTYRTDAGDQLIPSDNAPAWWMHHVAFQDCAQVTSRACQRICSRCNPSKPESAPPADTWRTSSMRRTATRIGRTGHGASW